MNERERLYWEKIAKALNQAPVRMTKEAKRRSMNFMGYLQFLDSGRKFILSMKKTLSPNLALGVESCHQRARELGLLKNAH